MASINYVLQSDRSYQRYAQEINEGRSPRPIGIALFGLGRIGIIHFKNVLTIGNSQLIYLVEEDRNRAENLIRKYNLRDTTITDPEDQRILEDSRVDAVIVCTPTSTHQAIVLNALKAGKSVFCEKPLASDYAGIRLCYETARLNGKILLCAFNRRFDPAIMEIEKRVKCGQIGKVSVIKTCSRDCPKPPIAYIKSSGGIFHDCAVHDIDVICWIMGSYPVTVYTSATAHMDDIKAINDFDTLAITLTFPDGAIGIIDISRHAVYGYDQRLEVFGSLGLLNFADKASSNWNMRTESASTVGPICYSFASKYDEAYLTEMENFFNDIRSGRKECCVTGENTLAVSKIAEACEESARNGKIVFLEWNKTNLSI